MGLRNIMVAGEKIAKLFGLIVLGLLVLSISNAEIAISPPTNINTVGYPGEILEYSVTIYNVGTSNETLSMFGAEIKDADTLTALGEINIAPSSSINVIISYQIPSGINPGSITPQISIFNSSGIQFTSIQLQGTVLAIPPKYSSTQISEALFLQNGLAGSVDPRYPFDIKLLTFNPAVSTTVKINILSPFTLNYPETVRIENGTSSIEIKNLTIPNNTIAGSYTLTISLNMPDSSTPLKTVAMNVKGYSDCSLKDESSIGIFGRNFKVAVTNPGTIDTTCTVESSYANIESALMSDPTDGAQITDGKITWTLVMHAGESRVVGYGVNYLPLVAIPFLVLVIGFSFWYFTRKLVITREVIDHKFYQGFTELKIQIHIKNPSKQDYKEVIIRDVLPAFVKEVKEFGTAQGSVEKHGKHRVVQWELKELKAGQEHVFNYRLRTSVEILGKMIFPQAIVTFYDQAGKKHTETSGPLVVEVQESKYTG